MSDWDSLMAVTEPHDILGALAIAILAASFYFTPIRWHWWGILLIIVIAVGIAVDLTAHRWKH